MNTTQAISVVKSATIGERVWSLEVVLGTIAHLDLHGQNYCNEMRFSSNKDLEKQLAHNLSFQFGAKQAKQFAKKIVKAYKS